MEDNEVATVFGHLDHRLGSQILETNGYGASVIIDSNDTSLGQLASVDFAVEKLADWVGVLVVVANVGIDPVLPASTGVLGQNLALGVGGPELRKGDRLSGDETKFGASVVADEALTGEVSPKGAGLAVVHNES